ncbi:MAG: hypothetical protein ACRC80_02635 [Waterburya sp.]
MYRLNSVKVTLVISQTALFLAALSYPAVSQDLGFVDLNQSRQFFSEGNQKFEGEIEQFEDKSEKLPVIKLPQGFHQPENINKSLFIDHQQKIKAMPSASSAIAEFDITDTASD